MNTKGVRQKGGTFKGWMYEGGRGGEEAGTESTLPLSMVGLFFNQLNIRGHLLKCLTECNLHSFQLVTNVVRDQENSAPRKFCTRKINVEHT